MSWFSTHITSDLDRIGDYLTLIHGGRIVRTGTKDEILEAYRVVRGGPGDLSDLVGVQPIGVRRTPTGAQALVRSEEADLLDGHVLVEAPTLEEVAIHIGARVPNGIQIRAPATAPAPALTRASVGARVTPR